MTDATYEFLKSLTTPYAMAVGAMYTVMVLAVAVTISILVVSVLGVYRAPKRK